MSRTEMKDSDREEVAAFIEQHWRSRLVMSHGHKYYPHREEGFLERRDGRIVGLVTYHVDGEVLELLTLNATLEREGIGSSLMLSVIERARDKGCRRVMLTTTNDNLRAIGFYQRLGFVRIGETETHYLVEKGCN